MMLWIVGILFVVMVLGFVGFVKSDKHDEQQVTVAIFGFSLMILGIIGIASLITYHEHCDELAFVRNSQAITAVHTQAIEDLDRQLSDLNKTIDNKGLFNADSPYRSLIEAKSSYVKALSRIRMEIMRVKTSILARKLGLMSYIVRWVGEE
jgi:hypothetical protein